MASFVCKSVQRGDEDEGSPSRDGANLLAGFDTPRLLDQRIEKIERSADALRASQARHLSLQNKISANNATRVTAWTKTEKGKRAVISVQ